MKRFLTALPVFNEVDHLENVLLQVKQYSSDILVVDDGSDDGTSELLDQRDDIFVERHDINKGYGAALVTAFQYAIKHGYYGLITIDCDGQHQPKLIPSFEEALTDQIDLVSGSRYLKAFDADNIPPEERLHINKRLTLDLNKCLNLELTDSFCGFKAYRVESLKQLQITESGYGMPLELWIQAVAYKWNIIEFAVPRIYLEEKRSFGGSLDNAEQRLKYYRQVIKKAIDDVHSVGLSLPNEEEGTLSPCLGESSG